MRWEGPPTCRTERSGRVNGTRGRGLGVKKGWREGKLERRRRTPVQPESAMRGGAGEIEARAEGEREREGEREGQGGEEGEWERKIERVSETERVHARGTFSAAAILSSYRLMSDLAAGGSGSACEAGVVSPDASAAASKSEHEMSLPF